MNYMLLIYHDEAHPHKAKGCDGLGERLLETGQMIAGGILHPTSSATSLRMRGGKRLVTDGPFAETREQLAGYMLINAADLDEAMTVAEQHPVAAYGTVEIRPVLEIPELAATR